MSILNKQKLTNRFIGCESDYSSADIVLFGAGFDGTTSYRPGTRFGGKVIREQSDGLETYSPYLNKDLTDCNIFDSGELELPFGDTQRVLDMIYSSVREILNKNAGEACDKSKLACPVMLGGEHLVTLPAIKACYEKYPDLRIIHLDAHTDLREDYLGEKLSHACVMRRCHEIVGDNRIFSFGIRSGTREEFEWAKEGHVSINQDIKENFGEAVLPAEALRPIYITIDIDVLDPSEFPATGTPEAGGWRFNYLRGMLKDLCGQYNIIGADLVEYSPPYDLNGVCAATAGKVLRELLLSISN